MNAKHSTRKRLWQRIKIIHRADYPTAIFVKNCIAMACKKSTIAMRDQFNFDFARYERLNAKFVENDRQQLFELGRSSFFR